MASKKCPRELLRAWREGLGLNFTEAAEKLSCDKSLYRRIELGEEDRIPGRRLANSMERVVGIPAPAWDELEDELKRARALRSESTPQP